MQDSRRRVTWAPINMAWIEPVSLSSVRVALEPLAMSHRDDLVDSVKDGELWNIWYTTVPRPENMGAEI